MPLTVPRAVWKRIFVPKLSWPLSFALVATLISAAIAWRPSDTVADTPATTEPGVDERIQPGDDFFGYANGNWLQNSQIPAGKDRWNARSEIDALAHQQVQGLFDTINASPAGSVARKVADFRTAYLNEPAIEASGLAPLRPMLKRIDGIHDKLALTRLLGATVGCDADPLNWGTYDSAYLLGLSVGPGVHGEKTNLALLVQGGLGLPEREYYVSDEPRMQALRSTYQAYIARMLTLAGFDHGEHRAEEVMALESALARSHATREQSGADDKNVDNLWKRADFSREAPGMDWSVFFDAAGLSKQETFVVWQPSAVQGTAELVAMQPLSVWRDYLRFHLIDRHADVLPRAFSAQSYALHGAALAGLSQPGPRAQRAIDATAQAMGAALGQVYAEHYFPPAVKARVQTIAANVIAAFRQHVEAATWMSPTSKAQALAKLQVLYFGVAYPDYWADYSGLNISARDAAGNLLRVAQWNYRQMLARLGQPVDPRAWVIAPHNALAVLLFTQNAYNFPAALLQAPKFDPAASDAANYGAIGAIIGHETSHFVDTLGADYDAGGVKVHWWTAQDAAHFDALAEPLVNQFSSYHPFADLAIDGKATRTENIADLAGLTAAFEAYRRTLGDRASDPAYVRAQDRQFFIGFARSWRGKTTEEALRKQIANNDHAPENYRIATVRNLDAWYEAFDVRPGQRLYLEPGKRVHIW
jgi:putative endopeptidase